MTPEDRAWEVVRRAFEERTPTPPSRAPRRLAVAAAVVACVTALIVAVVTPPGHAVLNRVRRAVGIPSAAPELVSLPADGRLLVVSARHGGVWLVEPNGLRRKLGDYADATWSPHGLFIVATTSHDLVALDSNGVRWTLPRPGARWPRWEGTITDTQIAYVTTGGLRVVAGDGTGDYLLDARAGAVPPAWDPARLHTLAYYSNGAIILRDTRTAQVIWRTPIDVRPTVLTWSTDGRFLVAVSPHRALVLWSSGRLGPALSSPAGTFVDASFRPRTHELALSQRIGSRSEISLLPIDRPATPKILFSGPGSFGGLAWSHDGTWLLVPWPTADQWLFLRGSHVEAVANIHRQFPRADGQRPVLEIDDRWCCPLALARPR